MNPHLSSEESSNWITGERIGEAERHLAACASCRGEVEGLESAFRQFRDSGQRWSEHWYMAPAPRPAHSIKAWHRLAATGGLVLAALLVTLRGLPPTPRAVAQEPFVAIPYVAPLAPYEQTRVVRMEVAMTALQAAGFEVHATELSGALTVDVLVGQDGRAHAIRPISRSVQQ